MKLWEHVNPLLSVQGNLALFQSCIRFGSDGESSCLGSNQWVSCGKARRCGSAMDLTY